jgi:hypothetical protein
MYVSELTICQIEKMNIWLAEEQEGTGKRSAFYALSAAVQNYAMKKESNFGAV